MNDQILTVINFLNDFDAYTHEELIENRESTTCPSSWAAASSAVLAKAYMAHVILHNESLDGCTNDTIGWVDEFFEKTGADKCNYPQYKGA